MQLLRKINWWMMMGFCSIFSLMGNEKPNIIFILTDDQGYGDLSCFGSETMATPSIDKLCDEGMKFTSFYVHNRCSPTRLALMTGSHAHRAGTNNVIYRHEGIGIHDDEITIAEVLKEAGYATGIVGKWHLGEFEQFNPTNHGFDSFYGFMHSDDRSKALFKNKKVDEKVKGITDGAHSPKLLKAGQEFIRENKDKPFFLYYASPLPHVKWLPHEKFKGTSKHGTYGDVIQEIDWQVGGLMETLEECGLSENTLVIYTSDNGPQLSLEGHGSSGPLRDGKWTNFEGGIRVPCIMRWPKVIKAGTENHQITGVIDILPTFCELAGVELPSDRVIDGKSILAYMKAEELSHPIHTTFMVPETTVRYKNWKLLLKGQSPGGKNWFERVPAKAGSLFDLSKDLGEKSDVSAQYPEKVKELTKMMEEFMVELKANSRPIGKVEGFVPPESKKSKKKKKD